MQILSQFFPFALIIIYFAVCIYVLTLLSRLVDASERIAGALENASGSLRKGLEQKKET
jgi:hypothetical protein